MHIYTRAYLGSLIADALSMPVHWYYDRDALDADYGAINQYLNPKHPHSGSILWRSKYKARNAKGDILREQAQYWGQHGVHYHQFLKAGENTINFRLAIELHDLVLEQGGYDSERWLERYIECMLQDGWHQDTYLEEYHRAFFDNYACGRAPKDCGIDDLHIGGLSQVPALLAALVQTGTTELEEQRAIVQAHVKLTHQNRHTIEAADVLTRILFEISQGHSLLSAIEMQAPSRSTIAPFEAWSQFPDRTVIGRHLSSACYLPESFIASLYLCWKYADDFEGGIQANAECGGDNCHRGAVVGSLLAANNAIEQHWIDGLKSIQPSLSAMSAT